MQITTVSGSMRPLSSNIRLLKSIKSLCPWHQFLLYDSITELPLFQAEHDHFPWPEEVTSWRSIVENSDAIIISTPEYIHNIPAVLKNALEWLTSSGEMMDKRVLPITFTPHPPRGEKALQSLTWSLQALKANVVTQLPLYQSEVDFNSAGIITNEEVLEILTEAVSLLE